MDSSQFRYTNIAFISYKREDEQWAKWLQKKLEHYKLPTEILKQNPEIEFSERPRHVFKDTTDLSGGVLAKAIKEGLDSSKFLIVICSPRAAKSEWVCKEVQDFIDSGREEFIIPFIIDGEPYAKNTENECFPAALKTLAGEKELLGININENGKDAAAMKVVARMFGLRFDTLWQRFKREKVRRKNVSFISVLLFAILISIIAFLFYIQNQKLCKTEDIMEINQSRAVLEKAKQLIVDGDLMTALLICNEILPNNNDRRFLPETEAIMYQANMQYEYGNPPKLSHIPVPSYHNNDDCDFGIVPGNAYIWTNSEKRITLFDVVSGGEKFSYCYDSSYDFSNDGEYFICTNNDNEYLELWNNNKHELIKKIKLRNSACGGVSYTRNNNQILVHTETYSFDVYDAFTLRYIESIDNMSFLSTENTNGNYLIDWDSFGVKIYNRITRKVYEHKLNIDFCRVGCSVFSCWNESDNCLYIYDIESGKLIENFYLKHGVHNIVMDPSDAYVVLLHEDFSTITCLNIKNSDKSFSLNIPTEIRNECGLYYRESRVCLTDRPYKNFILDFENKDIKIQEFPSEKIKLKRLGTTNFAQLFHFPPKEFSKHLTQYNPYLVEAYHEGCFNVVNDSNNEDYIYHCTIDDNTCFLVTSDTIAYIYNNKTNSKGLICPKLKYGIPIMIPNTDRFLFFTKEQIYFSNRKNWAIDKCVPVRLSNEYGELFISDNGKIIVRKTSEGAEVYSSHDGSLLSIINKGYDVMGISPSGKYIYANDSDFNMVLIASNSAYPVCTIPNWGSSNIVFDEVESIVAVICNTVVVVYNISENKMITKLEGHVEDINSIALSLQGDYLLSCSNYSPDQTVRLWNVNTGTQIYTFNLSDIYNVEFIDNDTRIKLSTNTTLFSNYSDGKITTYTIPFWRFEELIKRSRKLLRGRQLNAEEKIKYYLE